MSDVEYQRAWRAKRKNTIRICPNCEKNFQSTQTGKLCWTCWCLKFPEKRSAARLRARNAKRKKKGIDVHLPSLRKKANGIDGDGYRRVCGLRGHPFAKKDGCVLEHRFVMSEHLGRKLRKDESVHHKNGDRLDNRLENLELWSQYQLAGQRVTDKIEHCREFLAQYGYRVTKKSPRYETDSATACSTFSQNQQMSFI